MASPFKRPFFYRLVESANEDDDGSPTMVCDPTDSFQERLNDGSTRVEWASQRKSFVIENPSVISVSSREDSTIQLICRAFCGTRKYVNYHRHLIKLCSLEYL